MYLHDCYLMTPADVEILLVLSEEAYQAALVDRDRETQAVMHVNEPLPLSHAIDVTFDSDVFLALIAVLGTGVDIPGKPFELAGVRFEIEKLRYGKIILVTEDNENSRCRTSEIVHTVCRFMKPLLDEGRVFELETPLRPGFTHEEFVERVLNPQTRSLVPSTR